jgi:hypothetical protein
MASVAWMLGAGERQVNNLHTLLPVARPANESRSAFDRFHGLWQDRRTMQDSSVRGAVGG